jgi:hypothetical protein
MSEKKQKKISHTELRLQIYEIHGFIVQIFKYRGATFYVPIRFKLVVVLTKIEYESKMITFMKIFVYIS